MIPQQNDSDDPRISGIVHVQSIVDDSLLFSVKYNHEEDNQFGPFTTPIF